MLAFKPPSLYMTHVVVRSCICGMAHAGIQHGVQNRRMQLLFSNTAQLEGYLGAHRINLLFDFIFHHIILTVIYNSLTVILLYFLHSSANPLLGTRYDRRGGNIFVAISFISLNLYLYITN